MNDLQTELLKINAQFPVTGKDNSAEGFRNNFSYIKNSLEYADASIVELSTAISKTTTLWEQTEHTQDSSVTMATSQYQRITIAPDMNANSLIITLIVDTDNYCFAMIEIYNNSSNDISITFANSNITGKILATASPYVNLPSGNSAVYECWSADNGETIFIEKMGVFVDSSGW